MLRRNGNARVCQKAYVQTSPNFLYDVACRPSVLAARDTQANIDGRHLPGSVGSYRSTLANTHRPTLSAVTVTCRLDIRGGNTVKERRSELKCPFACK